MLAALNDGPRIRQPLLISVHLAIIEQHLPLEMLFVLHLRSAGRERPWHMTGVALAMYILLPTSFYVNHGVEVKSICFRLLRTFPVRLVLLLLIN